MRQKSPARRASEGLLINPSLARRAGWAIVLFVLTALPAEAQNEPKFLRKSVDDWVNQLKTGDAGARRNAAFALGKMSTRAGSALPEIKAGLRREKDAKVREALVCALGEVAAVSLQGGGDAEIERLLIEAAGEQEKLVRRSAVHSLGRLASKAAQVQNTLVRALGDAAPEVRQNAAWALGQLGEGSVSALSKALGDADALVKRDAASALFQIAQEKPDEVRPALAPLLTLCQDADAEARKSGLMVLVRIVNPKDAKAIPVVVNALRDSNVDVQRYAALALSNIGGEPSRAAVPILLATLRKGEVELQREAAMALHNIGPDAESAIDDLLKALEQPDPELRRFAALALGGIGPKAERAIPRLTQMITSADENKEARVEAAEALTRIGDVPTLRQAVPRLLSVLSNKSEDGTLRVRIAWVFNHLITHAPSMDAAYPIFGGVCAEPGTKENGSARYHCAYLLGVMQKDKAPDSALDVLAEWLKDDTGRFYLNKQSKVGATGQEVSSLATLREELTGDSRSMAVFALTHVANSSGAGARRVSARNDITRQLGLLVGDTKLNKMMRDEISSLLKVVS